LNNNEFDVTVLGKTDKTDKNGQVWNLVKKYYKNINKLPSCEGFKNPFYMVI
jgi:hypothetical protein